VTGFFTELGIPAPGFQAVFVALLETTGGLLLLVGLFSRLISIPLIVTMIVAYVTSEKEAIAALFTKDYEDFFTAAPGSTSLRACSSFSLAQAGFQSMLYGVILPRPNARQ
jgi:DoxX